MALGVQQHVGRLQVAVDQFPRVDVLQSLEDLRLRRYLVNYKLLVHLLEDSRPDDRVQVRLHVLEDQVQILLVLRFYYVQQLYDVLVLVQLLQKHHFPEGSLSIGCIVECVEHLF